MSELTTYSATQQARLIRERRVSSRELVTAHLERIAQINPKINAAVEVLAESALAAAAAADSSEPRGPLHGVPFSIKDSLELAGAVATAGTLGRKNAAASTEDATLVGRLRRAGAIPIAKTNLPDLLFAFESDNLIFGATRNPYDTSRTPGGSSGGEAALLAACGSPLGLGSDCAGSVRLPAAFCGCAAIKPTSGRLPRTGHVPPAGGWIEALWQIGPMARRVEDLITVMPLLVGPDERDHTVVDMPLANPRSVRVRDLRVAFYTDNGLAAADEEVAGVVRAAAAALAVEGARVEQTRPVCLDSAYEIEMKLIGPDGGDGLRGYLRDIGSTSVHPLLTGWLDKLEQYRTGIDGFTHYWGEWFRYRAEMAAFLACGYDAILCPAYIHPALPLGTSILDENFIGFSHTMAYNVAGWPAVVVRCGESNTGLPIAVQIAAAPWREDVALAVALWLEQAFGGWKPAAE
ncbi:MAG: amidase [Bryobacteraceae bacterium]|jgi:amidase